MVGGYASVKDPELLMSEEVVEIATFALERHAAGASTLGFSSTSMSASTSFLAVSPDEVEGGAVIAKVLEAQRQVVAGMNYKLTLAVLRDGVCVGAFKVTVYKALPHTGQGLRVTSWGNAMECDDGEIANLLLAATEAEMEEEKALEVERERKEESEVVEPDA